MPAAKVTVHIRWMIRRDMPEVLAIERFNHFDHWAEDDFLRSLRQRDCIGMIAEHRERIVGFMVYELRKTSLRIIKFQVHPDWRHCRIGAQLIAKLVGKLSPFRRTKLDAEVSESNLNLQLFLKRQGFRAIEILRARPAGDEGGYRMQYRLPSYLDSPVSRLSESKLPSPD
jgi:[ribosomal protein S18]-alanine N-acetyltransferase